MRLRAWLVLVFALVVPRAECALEPEAVVVLCNDAVPESRKLAAAYRQARGIPAANVISLEMPAKADITREEYEAAILRPLRGEFDRRNWWQRARDREGVTMPTANKIRVIAIMKGVPLRIERTAGAGARETTTADGQKDPFAGHDEASVDSELAMFGVEGLPLDGALLNRYHQSEQSIAGITHPYVVLTARIDAASYETCERMIADAVETEKSGLWGFSYVDVANKFPQGDKWLEEVVRINGEKGIPTVVDRFNETLPPHYPMTDAALYHGWYEWSLNGPFLHPDFRFRRGAVAIHIHSFSAQQLTDPAKNWCAGLLEKGAAATVGNVFEPYLHLTHDLGILHDRLLRGFTWVEACWMAMPVTSWQGVVLGDPLYRPYRHFDGTGEVRKEDADFRALRVAAQRWARDPDERLEQLAKAGGRTRSGVFAEAAGLDLLAMNREDAAAARFRIARELYPDEAARLRQDFHLIAIDRAAGRKDEALANLRAALARPEGAARAQALDAWIRIADPPPPPPPAAAPNP